MNNRNYVVYSLYDPRNGQSFYVGLTNNVERRMRQHTTKSINGIHSNLGIQKRINNILRAGYQPIIKILQSDMTQAEAIYRERDLIRKNRVRIVNKSGGGEIGSAKLQSKLKINWILVPIRLGWWCTIVILKTLSNFIKFLVRPTRRRRRRY